LLFIQTRESLAKIKDAEALSATGALGSRLSEKVLPAGVADRNA
jgi:hypothetical protein